MQRYSCRRPAQLTGFRYVFRGVIPQADALTVKYRQILKRILAAKIKMGEIIKDSSFAMVQAKYVAGDGVKHTIFDAVETAAVKASCARRTDTPRAHASILLGGQMERGLVQIGSLSLPEGVLPKECSAAYIARVYVLAFS